VSAPVSSVKLNTSHPELHSSQQHSHQSNTNSHNQQQQQQHQQQQQQQGGGRSSSGPASNHTPNAYGSGQHSHQNNWHPNSGSSGRVDIGVASNKTHTKKRSTDNTGSEVTNTTSGGKDTTGREPSAGGSSATASGVIKSITSKMPKVKEGKGETFDCKSILFLFDLIFIPIDLHLYFSL